MGASDGIYNKSKGGLTYSGWTCDHLPYLAELDNYGGSNNPGKAGRAVSGYGAMTKSRGSPISQRVSHQWLQYAWGWDRTTDPNGWLQMPGGRTATRRTSVVLREQPEPCVPDRPGRRGRHLWPCGTPT